MAMLPGVGQLKKQMAQANIDPKLIRRQEAIILSMTEKERANPAVIHASRKKRIAAGSGTSVQEVNRLLKQFKQMSGMMKKVNKMGKKGMMRGGLPGMPGPGMFPR
jgi:signal recognition particle subunit SRP54